MSREWKPGDVAMVTWTDSYDGEVSRAVRILVRNGTTDDPAGQRKPAWWGADGYLSTEGDKIDVRPLLVVDPEDREGAERLLKAMTVNGPTFMTGLDPANRKAVDDAWLDHTQAALRSLVTPAKPEEPTGLGAVVEDADGQRFTRVDRGGEGLVRVWIPANKSISQPQWASYDQIAAVKVLSEGVTP